MATSNAQRQRNYRQRHLQSDDGKLARLSMVVSWRAKAQLWRLARHHKTTQREMLERLIGQAEDAVSGTEGYFDDRYRVTREGV